MARAKKYKTVAGALRASSNEIWAMAARAERQGGDSSALAEDCVRRAINNILPQLGMSDRIRPDEKPSAGIARMLEGQTHPTMIKHLNECRRFIKRAYFPMSATMTGVSTIAALDRPVTYVFLGISREDHTAKFIIWLDGSVTQTPWGKAREIAGLNVCLITAMNVTSVVPAKCKGRLLPEAEAYGRVPECDPDRKLPRRKAAG
jgi:hypothetical protein